MNKAMRYVFIVSGILLGIAVNSALCNEGVNTALNSGKGIK